MKIPNSKADRFTSVGVLCIAQNSLDLKDQLVLIAVV